MRWPSWAQQPSGNSRRSAEASLKRRLTLKHERLRTMRTPEHSASSGRLTLAVIMGSLLTLMRNWEEDALGYFVGTLSTVPPLTMDDFNHAASEAMSWAASLGQ